MAKKKKNAKSATERRRTKLPVKQLPNVEVKPEDDCEEDTDNDGLTIRRRMFVEAITGPATGNATKAARMAGYADSNSKSLGATAARLLGFVSIQKAIARTMASRRLDPQSVKIGIAEIATSDMSNFLRVEDGQPVFDWNAAAAAGAIGQIKEWVDEGHDAGDGPVIIKRKFKIHDRLRALELLAKINGLLKDQQLPDSQPAPYFDTSGEMDASLADGQVPAMPADANDRPPMASAVGPRGVGLVQPGKPPRPER